MKRAEIYLALNLKDQRKELERKGRRTFVDADRDSDGLDPDKDGPEELKNGRGQRVQLARLKRGHLGRSTEAMGTWDLIGYRLDLGLAGGALLRRANRLFQRLPLFFSSLPSLPNHIGRQA